MYIYIDSCITVCETFPYSLRVKKNPQKYMYFIITLQKKKFTFIFTIIIFFSFCKEKEQELFQYYFTKIRHTCTN